MKLSVLSACAVLLAAVLLCHADTQFGSLKLTSEPDSAVVLLDGQERGITPIEIGAIKPGPHTLIVLKPGYRRYERELMYQAGKRKAGNARLEAMTPAEMDSARVPDSIRAIIYPRFSVDIPEKNQQIAISRPPELLRKVDPAQICGPGSGKVIMHAMIGEDGSVVRVEIARSSGLEWFDAIVKEAIAQWYFSPALDSHGKPVRIWVMIPFSVKYAQ